MLVQNQLGASGAEFGDKMARMHSRKHGRSRSKKPIRDKPPGWVKYDKKEIEKLIVKYAKEGKNSAAIGLILRDNYGIPSVKELTGKSITVIMRENDNYPSLPEDLYSLFKKASSVMDHLQTNKKDAFAIHGLELTEAKIRRLGKYYIRKKKLPAKWKYNPDEVKLIVK